MRPLRPAVLLRSSLLATLALLATAAAPALRAHDPGLSLLTLRRTASGAELQWVVNDADLPPPRAASGKRCSADGVLSAWLDGEQVPIRVRCHAHDDHHTTFEAAFALLGESDLRLALPLLAELPRGHRSWARALDRQGRVLTQSLLSRESESLRMTLASPAWSGFAWLGAQRVVGQLDQLLLALLLVAFGRAARPRLAALGGCGLGFSLGLGFGLHGPFQPAAALTDGLVLAALVVGVACHALPRAPRAIWLAWGLGCGLALGLRSAAALSELGVASLSAAALPRVLQFGLGVALTLAALASLGAACRAGLAALGQGLRARALNLAQRRIRT